MTTVLITSAGSLIADALRRCLAPIRQRLTLVGVNSIAAPNAFAFDRLHRVPPTAETVAHRAALCAVIEAERPALVLIGRDEDVPSVAAIAASGRHPGTVFPVPPPSLAPVFADKRRSWGFARDHGLPFAATAETADEAQALLRRHGFPLIAKPWQGAGSQNVWLIRDRAQLAAALADPDLMVQAFSGPEALRESLGAFDGLATRGMPWRWGFLDEEATAELTFDGDGQVTSMFLDAGTTAPPLRTTVRPIDDRAVRAVALAWAEAMTAAGHRGPLNIQGKRLADGRFVPYEIAARFGGTSVARAALGHNQVLRLVTDALGWSPPPAGSRAAVTTLRLRTDLLPDGWRRSFEEDGVWTAEEPAASGAAADWPVAAPSFFLPAAPPILADGGDRAAAVTFARRHRLPFLPTALTVGEAEGLFAGGLHPPLILKPRCGDGPALVLERWEEAMPALAAGEAMVQPLLGADDLERQRTVWRTRPGSPWLWAIVDQVVCAEFEAVAEGASGPPRIALCRQKGGEPGELRRVTDDAVADSARRWAAALVRAGYRGPLRLTGKRDAEGLWQPFAAGSWLLHLPAEGCVQSRLWVPIGSGSPFMPDDSPPRRG